LHFAIIDSPIGKLRITSDEHALAKIDFVSANTKCIAPKYPLLKTTAQQLNQYFNDPLFTFQCPLTVTGTPFQHRVWRYLLKLDPSQTCHYGDIAKSLNSAAQAVGQALKANPIPIIIPCHRVVAKTGLGGYSGNTAGKPLARKTWLLKHENAIA